MTGLPSPLVVLCPGPSLVLQLQRGDWSFDLFFFFYLVHHLPQLFMYAELFLVPCRFLLVCGSRCVSTWKHCSPGPSVSEI